MAFERTIEILEPIQQSPPISVSTGQAFIWSMESGLRFPESISFPYLNSFILNPCLEMRFQKAICRIYKYIYIITAPVFPLSPPGGRYLRDRPLIDRYSSSRAGDLIAQGPGHLLIADWMIWNPPSQSTTQSQSARTTTIPAPDNH